MCFLLKELWYAGRRGERGGVVLFQMGTGPCGEARFPSYQTPSEEELLDLPKADGEEGLSRDNLIKKRREAFWDYPGAGGAPVCDPFLRASWEMYCRAYDVNPDTCAFLHACKSHAILMHNACSSPHPGCFYHVGVLHKHWLQLYSCVKLHSLVQLLASCGVSVEWLLSLFNPSLTVSMSHTKTYRPPMRCSEVTP
jgi:hypothetical protein